jgi:release factor glutamine methyltransferase
MMRASEVARHADDPHERDTVRSLLQRTAQRMAAPELRSEGPEMEARELLAFALGAVPAALDARLDQRVAPEQRQLLDELVKRRLRDEPTGYIVGAVELRGVRFKVDRRAFIARQDLPVCVDAALEGVPRDVVGRACDLACGMGAAGILVGIARPGLLVDLADVHAPSVELSQENGDALVPGRAHAFVSDLFDGLPSDRRGQYDVITANPPWVPDGTELPAEVIDHEPSVSFFGGPDGLNIVRRLIRELPAWLKRGGRYAQECDPSQIEKVKALLTEAGFVDARAHRDAEGVERVVSASKP